MHGVGADRIGWVLGQWHGGSNVTALVRAAAEIVDDLADQTRGYVGG